MKPDYYKELEYWKKYLSFLPIKYRESYEVPDETYWKWNEENVHVDFKFKDNNKVSVIIIHGAGGNGRILSLIGSHFSQQGINYYAPDNLGYGLTKTSKSSFDYGDLVDMLCAFTQYIIQKDKNPVVLLGMSVGGMLAYQVASNVEAVNSLIVTTLADPRDEESMIAMAKNKFIATKGLKFGEKFKFFTDNLRLPIKWLCKMDRMSRNPEFSKIFEEDPYGGGVRVSFKFLRTFSTYSSFTKFEDFNSCPVMLIHPEKDNWTPFKLSKKVFDKLKVNKELHLLPECGHAPIEEPGIYDMESHILRFIKKNTAL